jgi:BirA family biotin operon repressor/biotin-[acetyl-CoA-carboxylase] ligase
MPEKKRIIGNKIIHLASVTSTNDHAYQLARQGECEGCVVRADAQTAGKGRRGKCWHSAANQGLWFSIILRPGFSSKDAGLVPFFASIAIQQSIRTVFQIEADLKWPNDLLIHHKKICGILSEADFKDGKISFIILGIGINLFQQPEEFSPELTSTAGSIRMFTDKIINTDSFFQVLLTELDFYYQKILFHGFSPILTEWKSNCRFLKKQISLKKKSKNLIGIFEDLLPDGSMLFRQNGDTIKITSAELEILK